MPENQQNISMEDTCCGPGYATPEEAMRAEPEKVLYTAALYVGTDIEEPDYLATVDVDPDSETYSQVIHRTPMPNLGDELHHSGWNACSSCHGDESRSRRFLILAAQRSGRIHLRPREPSAHRSGLVRRPVRQGRRDERPQAGGRPADAPAIPRR